MRKVTTINLNNNAYQIEEEGYEALRDYLDDAARALEGNPDSEEILSDLEQAIADKCALALGPHKNVVSFGEIERILREMGPVAGSADQSTSGPSGNPGQSNRGGEGTFTETGYRPRRLYRISEGRVWAGLCQGLAAYIGVDAGFVRLAVILITIFTGFLPGLFVYFVMCFAVPAARTSEEVAAAHGQPFRAQELVDRVKKKHMDFRAERKERRMNRSAWWTPQTTPQPPPGYAARITGGVMLPLLTVVSAAWFAAMGVAAFVVWHGWQQAGFTGWPPESWHVHADFPRWVAMVAIVAVYALFALPVGAARRASLYYANGGRLHGWADAWSGILWIVVVALLALAAWYALPQLQELLRFRLQGPAVFSV